MSKARQFGSRWFRVYDESVDDPKIQMLTDRLHRFWFNSMCLASKSGGYLPSVTEIAWRLRKTEPTVTALLTELYERGLLDREADTFSPHNWFCRQFESDVSTPRVRKFREHRKGASETPDETFPKRDETVSETHQSRTEQNRADTEQTRAEDETRRAAVSEQEWPEATAVIQGRYPSTDGMFVLRLVQDSIQAAISRSIDPALVTDKAVAAAVAESFRTDTRMKSAGLLLKTVPTIICNWGKR